MKLFNVLVIMSSICVNFISCTLTTGPQNDKLEGLIVFSARETPESNSQLYTMNAVGSEIRQLTFFENTNAYNPRWSPDGEQIVFTSDTMVTTLGLTLTIMNADGTDIRPLKILNEEHQLALPGDNPVWSPDGTKIAYDLCIDCELGGNNYEIFIYVFTTDEVTQITDSQSMDTNPSWSYDGKNISFSSNRDHIEEGYLKRDIYTMDSDGNNIRKLTNAKVNESNIMPLSSPINKEIAYHRISRKENVRDIFIIDENLQSNRVTNTESIIRLYSWFPNGNNMLIGDIRANDYLAIDLSGNILIDYFIEENYYEAYGFDLMK